MTDTADLRSDELPVIDNREAGRYELRVGDRLALAEYRPAGDALMLTHTEVPAELEGQGVGARLVRFALDDARARGLKVLPFCRFVAAFIRRHPDYLELVPEERRATFKL